MERKTLWSTVLAVLAMCGPVQPLAASDTCTGANLPPGTPLPYIDTPVDSDTGGDDFGPAHASCSDAAYDGVDSVVCFSPTTSCNITIFGLGIDGNINTALRVYQNTACGSITNATPCLASTVNSSGPVITNLPVTAGTLYCVVCEGVGADDRVRIQINQGTGPSCGTLPVGLESFTAE